MDWASLPDMFSVKGTIWRIWELKQEFYKKNFQISVLVSIEFVTIVIFIVNNPHNQSMHVDRRFCAVFFKLRRQWAVADACYETLSFSGLEDCARIFPSYKSVLPLWGPAKLWAFFRWLSAWPNNRLMHEFAQAPDRIRTKDWEAGLFALLSSLTI